MPDAEDSLILLTLVYMVFVILASLWLGRLSDKLGRRRAFVFVASVLQAAAALILAFVPTMGAATVGAALLGLGYGCFLSVDQALATEVLPDQLSRGKDLGIMNIALTVPQAFAPMLGALLVSAVGGFTLLFLVFRPDCMAGAWPCPGQGCPLALPAHDAAASPAVHGACAVPSMQRSARHSPLVRWRRLDAWAGAPVSRWRASCGSAARWQSQ